MDHLASLAALRRLYDLPKERAIKKQLAALDVHCIRFVSLSPFVVLATHGADGTADASPRGGAPGFVRVRGAHTLLIPDAPGNNRLDTLENIVATGQLGLLFMIPGLDETLRVNGPAVLSTAAEDLAATSDARRTPKLAIRVTVREAYLHCAKAFMRSDLWAAAARFDRAALPTAGQMLCDHTGVSTPPETPEAMRQRYEPDL